MNIHHFEMDTNDCDMIASDLQAGKTAVAKGRKIVGTGKCFKFALYGGWSTNLPDFIRDNINVIHLGCEQYPLRMTVLLQDMKTHDFSVAQKMAEVTVDSVVYPIVVSAQDGMLDIVCDKTIDIELFYGKDEYI
jgi:hypothetical protein